MTYPLAKNTATNARGYNFYHRRHSGSRLMRKLESYNGDGLKMVIAGGTRRGGATILIEDRFIAQVMLGALLDTCGADAESWMPLIVAALRSAVLEQDAEIFVQAVWRDEAELARVNHRGKAAPIRVRLLMLVSSGISPGAVAGDWFGAQLLGRMAYSISGTDLIKIKARLLGGLGPLFDAQIPFNHRVELWRRARYEGWCPHLTHALGHGL